MKQIILSFLIANSSIFLAAQTALIIPDTLSGSLVDLTIAESSRQFFSSFTTSTIGYNGSYLGPTIILYQGRNIALNVHNQLADTTTTHWHGLHVAPMNDGSPHNPILTGNTWSPGFTVMDQAATYWYHPHLHGKTMSQVMKGAAGLIIVRDSAEANIILPRTYGVDDFPLIFQWQHFDSSTKQIIIDDEADNATLVNGILSTPYQNIPAQVVRLRLLNASSHRFFMFGFDDNRTFKQIASDGGLLNAPVSMTRLMLGSGERAEILVDFTGQQGNTFFIKQFGTQLPTGYPGGRLGMMGGTLGPLDNTDFNLLQFNVVAPTSNPVTTLPTYLIHNEIYPTAGADNFDVRIAGSPMMSMTNFTMNGVQYDEEVINMTTNQNTIMTWTITNQSMMPHPFHIHGNHFYVLSVNGATPPANMQGRKDVVVVPPIGGSVVIITRYSDFGDPLIPYMFHCHILSHEDNGMMGQFIINPSSTGIQKVENKDLILLYPNPAQDYIILQSDDDANIISQIEIVDLLGQMVYTNEFNATIIRVPTQQLNNGTYFINTFLGKNVFTQKLLINR